MRVFIDWFNRVWKVAPNAIADELERRMRPTSAVDAHAARDGPALDWFESLLDGRDFLIGDELSAADFVAFPFLKYATRASPTRPTTRRSTTCCTSTSRWATAHRRLRAWIDRVDALPRACALAMRDLWSVSTAVRGGMPNAREADLPQRNLVQRHARARSGATSATPARTPTGSSGAAESRKVDADYPKPGATLHHTQGVPKIGLKDTSSVVDADPPADLELEVRIRPFAVNGVRFILRRRRQRPHPRDDARVAEVRARSRG